jgi:hypothetical protein
VRLRRRTRRAQIWRTRRASRMLLRHHRRRLVLRMPATLGAPRRSRLADNRPVPACRTLANKTWIGAVRKSGGTTHFTLRHQSAKGGCVKRTTLRGAVHGRG